MRGGIPGRRTDVCTYNDKCLAEPSDQFGVDLCTPHALKVHTMVEFMLARERISEKLLSRPERPPGRDVTSEFRDKCDGWVARSANGESSPAGYVYFVRFDRMIKIGFSRNPAQRLKEIPHQEVLKVVEGTMADEFGAHGRCSEWRVVGEWFRDCPEFRAAAGLA